MVNGIEVRVRAVNKGDVVRAILREMPADAAVAYLGDDATDERVFAALHPDVDLTQLPVWALWREDDNANKFEMARYRSYAKAIAREKIYRDRGHRQFYWVDPA